MLSKSHREEQLPGAAREVDETSRALSCAVPAAIIDYPSHAFSRLLAWKSGETAKKEGEDKGYQSINALLWEGKSRTTHEKETNRGRR